MAQDIGTVYVQVVPSGKDFGKNIEGQISRNVVSAGKTGGSGLLKTMTGVFGKVGKLGVGAIATIGGGITALAAKGGFERALNIENAQAKLKGLGHSTEDISQIMDNALASVKGTAFGLGDAATVAASLSASGVKSGQQMTDVLKTVADTAQISGRSLTDIGTIFGSVAARGKLQGDDMLQLMSSGVPVLQLLATHMGKTSAEVSDMSPRARSTSRRSPTPCARDWADPPWPPARRSAARWPTSRPRWAVWARPPPRRPWTRCADCSSPPRRPWTRSPARSPR